MPYSIEDLNHAERGIRLRAMSAFIESGQTEIPALLRALHHPEAEIRWRVAVILGWVGDAATIPPLIAALDDPAGYDVRINVAWALGHIRDKGAIEALSAIVYAEGDKEPDIRYVAALGLAFMSQTAAIQQALASSNEASYRVAHSALVTLAYHK